jgi:hypothetical protein
MSNVNDARSGARHNHRGNAEEFEEGTASACSNVSPAMFAVSAAPTIVNRAWRGQAVSLVTIPAMSPL